MEIENIKNSEWKNQNIEKKGTNQMYDIVYNSKFSNDNNYIIKAEFGEFNKENPDIMLLTNVNGKIFFKDSSIIEINSKKANYNSIDYNTNFYQNVFITYNDHQINSDNFDLFFDIKLGTIYNNIIYKNLNTILRADKIDIDLITKDSKIYMLDQSETVKLKHSN
ncbi:hypothetical protein N8Z07_03160 [Pelagibacteraceae bacterium]|nr:hypothetical protein [Pelagibacteraceae bacterium]